MKPHPLEKFGYAQCHLCGTVRPVDLLQKRDAITGQPTEAKSTDTYRTCRDNWHEAKRKKAKR